MVVAVKVINLEERGAAKSFMAECETLRSIRHRNLLKIVTVCSSTDFQGNDFKALVYEFMTNGSLHQWIFMDARVRILSLLHRVDIAIDVASALDYLHNGCGTPIIHCDLKPSNILLDNDMVAHVGDFGLARFLLRATANNSSSIAVKGTVGYAAPEYGLGSMVSKEGDVYSFGIVLLEMMISKSPTGEMFERGLNLHNYANSAALSDQLVNIIDPRLLENGGTSEGNEGEILTEVHRKHKCIRSIIEIGVKCSMESPQDRMKIEDAIGELQVTKDALLKQLHVIRAKRV
ncbi:probable LRR receptor-like serine/threonine-protein kinase At3g47570 [Chenopodium quinoa]|uniref:probable LRR receptor-like serine/threonine-protein kinase At3g47570 n=1 Tax=Chenopodium quinoa TaxID=63459 RepID=UPI000B790BCB|nr:probable LRR receptor-like serine/threonine-protein kinase At3g47570 [Chenopodium quinoa]